MSTSSQNLIEVQSALQDPTRVSMQDLIKYVNGSNPEVPSFLALIELNRRKQIEQTSQDFSQPQGTVKDQTIQSLMGQANPTQAPQMVNPAAAPQMANPTVRPQQVMPGQAPQMVNPGAAPQPVRAAQGGLASIPVKMFKHQNFAGGGIVAFAPGGDVEDEYEETEGGLRVLKSELGKGRTPTPREKYMLGGREIQGPRSMEEIMGTIPQISPLAMKRPDDMTPEQAYQRQKEIQKLAGVAEDPYADIKKRQADIESRQAESRKGDALDRLLAMGEAFATADPTKGFGVHGAAASKASRGLEAEQRALREKQDAASMVFHQAMAKEEDARRRGDATGIAGALEAQRKSQMEWDKLEMERVKADQARFKIGADLRQSDAQAAKLPIDIFGAETQRKQQEATAAHQANQDALAELSKPTSADINFSRIMSRVNQDPEIKNLAAQLKNYQPGEPEYAAIQAAMYRKLKTYFAGHPDLLPPPPEGSTDVAPPKQEKSWNDWLSEKGNWGLMPGRPGAQATTNKVTPLTIPEGWSVQQNQ